MTRGFVDEGFEPVWANDFNPHAANSYNANFGPHCHCGDLVSWLERHSDECPRAEVVIGGPPCQGFSLLNKDKAGDPRRQLWRPFLDIVSLSRAEVFVMENVPQLIGTPEHEAIVSNAGRLGYRTASRKLLAADYGVPQTRLRAFIVGVKDFDPSELFPPPPTHLDPKKDRDLLNADMVSSWRTVRDSIGDLDPPIGTEIRKVPPPYELHFGRNPTQMSLERYMAIPEEGMNRENLLRNAPNLTPQCWVDKKGGTDLFGRLWWDRPAFTIRTEFFKPEKGRYLHPDQHRPITHREAARLQSFPDDFVFTGSKIEIARQIGNAVPVLLASAVARSVLSLLREVRSCQSVPA